MRAPWLLSAALVILLSAPRQAPAQRTSSWERTPAGLVRVVRENGRVVSRTAIGGRSSPDGVSATRPPPAAEVRASGLPYSRQAPDRDAAAKIAELVQLAELRQTRGDLEGALEPALQAVELARKTYKPNDILLAPELALAGELLLELGRFEEAAPLLSETIGIAREHKILQEGFSPFWGRARAIEILHLRARALRGLGRHEDAANLDARADELHAQLTTRLLPTVELPKVEVPRPERRRAGAVRQDDVSGHVGYAFEGPVDRRVGGPPPTW